MALVPVIPSIFDPVLQRGVDVARNIATESITIAAENIAAGARFQTAFANPENLKRAAVNTGLETEIIQDRVADMAHTHYDQYLALKRKTLGEIRAEVMRTYLSTERIYKELGYTDLQAQKIAEDIAKDVKAAQMKSYYILFPHSGNKIQKVY